MKKAEFDFTLKKGEGYFVEFKEKPDKSFSRELVAFANASGGQVFLGVNDKNQAKGINKIKRLYAENNVEDPGFIFNEFFTVVFKRKLENEGLNEELKSLLQTIIKYPGIQNKGLSEKPGNRPVKTIERQISELVKLNKVKRKGSKKTGGYYAI